MLNVILFFYFIANMSSNEYVSVNRLATTVSQNFDDSLYVVVYFDTYYTSSFNRVNIQPLKIMYINKQNEFKSVDDLFQDIRYVTAPKNIVKNIAPDTFAKLIIDTKETNKTNNSEQLTFHIAHVYPIDNKQLHEKLNPLKKEISKEIIDMDIDL